MRIVGGKGIMARAGGAARAGRPGYQVLGIYLNDHLAGATAGTQLAARIARTHQDRGNDSSRLRRLAAEVAQDRSALVDIMTALEIPVRAYKAAAAWAGEKAGRLKFNGHLFTRSPLSSLEELEMMRLAVEGKAAGWRTLRTLADTDTDTRLDPGRLDELIARARRQSDLLEELRVSAAAQVTSPAGLSARPMVCGDLGLGIAAAPHSSESPHHDHCAGAGFSWPPSQMPIPAPSRPARQGRAVARENRR